MSASARAHNDTPHHTLPLLQVLFIMIFGAGPPSGFFYLPYVSCFFIGFCGIISACLCYRYPKNDIPYFWPITIHSSQFRHSPLITHHSSLVNRHSPLITHQSALINRHSSLVSCHSSLITNQSSLTIHHSSLTTQFPS